MPAAVAFLLGEALEVYHKESRRGPQRHGLLGTHVLLALTTIPRVLFRQHLGRREVLQTLLQRQLAVGACIHKSHRTSIRVNTHAT